MYFVTVLNLVLQQPFPLTAALAKTKADTYHKKELFLIATSLVVCMGQHCTKIVARYFLIEKSREN